MTEEGLSRKHLRKFPKPVQDALLAVLGQGVRGRMPDAGHVLLYPKDRASRPFKVSAHRPEQGSLKFISDFCRDNQLEQP